MWFPKLPKYIPVKAYYLGCDFLSGLREIEIEGGASGPYGLLNVLGLERFFPLLSRIAHHSVVVTSAVDNKVDNTANTSLKFFVYYDQQLHDERSDECPYLFVLMGEGNVPCDMTGCEREVRGMVSVARHLPSKTRHPLGLVARQWR